MLKDLHKKVAVALVLGSFVIGSSAMAAPSINNLGGSDPGVQLHKTREYLERERVARQIQEDRAKQVEKVQDETQAAEEQQGSVTFVLSDLIIERSDVLTRTEIDGVTKDYVGAEVSLNDLNDIVSKINKLYADKGYLTCRAYLPPQTIKNGVVQIKLIEGKTGKVIVQGNDTTEEDYVTERLTLTEGRIDNINELNEELLLFNAMHDAQMRISMQAGEVPGTTDYVISMYEPKRYNWTLFADNSGSSTTGEYRTGLFYQDRSLTGHRDALSVSSMISEGVRSIGVGYDRQIHKSGTKMNVQYNTNSMRITDGQLTDLDVKGHAYAASVGITQPLVVTENVRTEASLTYNQQNSKTDFLRIDWLDDTIRDATAAYSVTKYTDSSIFYSKHGYTFGHYENIEGATKNYGLYELRSFYQKAYKNGHMLSARLDAQLSGNNYMPSARQFYIGGVYSVRGYKESLLGGDHGYALSLEYAIPVINKKTSLFAFFDHGAVYGDSAFDDHVLTSVGIGVKTMLNNSIYTMVTLGMPLKKELNGTKAGKSRLNFMVNTQL